MQYSITTISYTASPARLEQMFWLFHWYVAKPSRGGVTPKCPVVTTATAVKILTVNFS